MGSLHGGGTLHVPRSAFGENAEPPRHFLVRFLDVAEVAAEPILVQLLVGLHVPQPAIVRADLVRQDDSHLDVLIEPAELQLEVDQLQANAEYRKSTRMNSSHGYISNAVFCLKK